MERRLTILIIVLSFVGLLLLATAFLVIPYTISTYNYITFLDFKDSEFSINIPSNVIGVIDEAYKNATTEQVFCLSGIRDEKDISNVSINVNGISKANVVNSTESSFTIEKGACPVDTISLIHTHPKSYKTKCKISINDVYMFGFLQAEGIYFKGIYCGELRMFDNEIRLMGVKYA